MQSILTQCPRCQTSFKVSAKQLEIAEGFVRCGSCLDVFSALANRITLKQPASTNPPKDALEADYEDEEAAEKQTLDDNTASPSELTDTTSGTPAITSAVEAFDLSYAGTLQYPVSHLVDADDVIPVNVAADVYTSSFTNDDSGFVFDDDIPLGDMVLDDGDIDAADELEVTNDEDDVLEATEESEDDAYSASAAVYEEYAEADTDDDAYIDVIDEEITPPEPVLRQTRPDTAASYEDALMTDDDLGSTFEEEFHDEEETILLQLDAEFTAGEPPVPGFVEDSPQQPVNDAEVNVFANDEAVAEHEANASAYTQEKSVVDIEADAIFHSVHDAAVPADTESTLGPATADQNQNTPVNQEAVYEAYAASIPAEAGAEEPQEIVAQGFGATRNDDDSLEPADSFTADNFSHIDEFQADGFSAVTADKADEFVDLPSKAPSRHEKAELRQYLADLEDTDALEPLPATTMDAIEAEPLTFEVGHSFRKYISTFGWFCLSLALVAVFVFQVVANNLELMQQSPVYSRYLPLFCRVLDCPAPAPVTAGIESLYAQDLLVRSHPRIPDALEVSFIFRNDAELPQPFPLVELNFRDNNKRLIANRLLKPLEYLPPELAVLDMMPARSSVQVMLELADPGSEAVDYQIIFRDAP